MSEIRKIKHWGLSGEQNGMFGKNGELNPNWRGGVTPERQLFYASAEWKNIVQVIWKRDKATCQKCSDKKIEQKAFHIHHVVPFEVVDFRTDETNLMLVCKNCHDWVHSKKNKNGEYIGTVLEPR